MVDFLSAEGVGYLLVALGVILLIAEAFAPGFFIAVPATILVILGVFALVTPDFGIFTAWAPLVVLFVGIPATFVTLWVYRRIAPPDAQPTTQTATNLVGVEGVVLVKVSPENSRGKVKVRQQVWSAVCREGEIPPSTRVRVVEVEGVLLVVQPVSESFS